RDDALRPEDLLDVAGVALGAVAHDDLVGGELDTPLAVVVADDRVEEKIPARLRRIAAEGLGARPLVSGLLHPVDGRRGPGARRGAEAQAKRLRAGVARLIFAWAAAGLAEEIARAQL